METLCSGVCSSLRLSVVQELRAELISGNYGVPDKKHSMETLVCEDLRDAEDILFDLVNHMIITIKSTFRCGLDTWGEGYSHLLAILVCAAGEGMVSKPLGLVKGLVIIENWSSIGSV